MNTTSEMEVVSPRVAQEILANYQYDKQRPLRAWHVKQLADEMEHGRFSPDAIKLANVNGVWRLLDGQHRLQAIIQSGKTYSFPVIRYTGLTPEEASTIYAYTDIPLRRSDSDSARAYEVDVATGLTQTHLLYLGGALEVIHSEFKPIPQSARMSRSVKAGLCVQWARWYRLYQQDAMIQSTIVVMKRASVVSVALQTYRYVPDKASDFWHQVAVDDGLRLGDPRKTLGAWLRNTRNETGSPTRYTKRMASRESISRGCATAWNAWTDGRELKIIRPPDDRTPICISGTGYSGEER